jgi:molybdopterin molybdotransferase
MERNITADRAVELLLAREKPVETETVPLAAAAGRILARDAAAERDVPPFDRSPLDGYALRSADTQNASPESPVTLPLTEELPAGRAPSRGLEPGQAAKVSTGAPLPEGTDCVVGFEHTRFTPTSVTLSAPCQPGNVVRRGEDVAVGSRIAPAGTEISPGLLGALAGQGWETAEVYRRPRVSLISTGSELREPGQPLEPGAIYNSGRYTLLALVEKLGALPRSGGCCADDPAAIAAAVSRELETADLVITTGGASVGDYDYARAAVEQAGGTLLFQKLRMRPGGAMLAAECRGKMVLCLSGNPGAAAVGLLRVGAPLIRRLAGRREAELPRIRLALEEAYPKSSPLPRLLRGRLEIRDGKALFRLNPGQHSGSLTSFLDCNLLAELPEGAPPLPPGTLVEAYQIWE